MVLTKKDDIIYSLIMPCYNCHDTIKRAIDSILDQDEESWELICVVNGDWKEKAQTIKIIEAYMKKNKNIKLLLEKEGNACNARNKGAEISTGKYISFFSSDFVMYPGALTKWKRAFEANPSADFIYSGYALMDMGKATGQFVPSQSYDPYLLEVHNYIDGGFPMKRTVWEQGKWDVNIKSLNDWDFWLTAKDNKFLGVYINDPTYMAEIPHPGGLSYDSTANWNERVNYIKKKHGIPKRDICVVSLGAQPHGIKLAKVLNADFRVWFKQDSQGRYVDKNEYKAIYLVGFYIGNGDSAIRHSEIFKDFNGKQIIHWIGTDIFQLSQAGYKVCYNDMKNLIDQLENRKNLVEFEQTQREMDGCGLKTEIVPLPIENKIELMPLPKEFTVAVYVPNTPTAQRIYNLDLTRDIIKSCPDIKFLAFGGGDIGKFKNLKNVGWTVMRDVLEQSSMLMRLTFHDGLPIAPIEFKLAGRDAMTTVQMPYVYFAGDGIVHKDNYAQKKEGIIAMLRDIKKAQKKSGVKDREKAREHYLKLTDPKEYKKRIRAIVDE